MTTNNKQKKKRNKNAKSEAKQNEANASWVCGATTTSAARAGSICECVAVPTKYLHLYSTPPPLYSPSCISTLVSAPAHAPAQAWN